MHLHKLGCQGFLFRYTKRYKTSLLVCGKILEIIDRILHWEGRKLHGTLRKISRKI